MKTEIEKKQRLRFVVLYELYKITMRVGLPKPPENFSQLAKKLDIDAVTRNSIHSYLLLEEFIFVEIDKNLVGITHAGCKIVEHIVTNPNERTFNFPSFKEMGF
jgi:hypothetical protein